MSRAFVKEQDADFLEDLPDRQISEFPNHVTPEGLAQIDAALAAARTTFIEGRARNDRAAMAMASRDLRYWNARRATARVVPPLNEFSVARFGSVVTIRRDDGREQSFRIVGEDEANPSQGTISHVSPLARGILGKRLGDYVKAGNDNAEITNIQ